MLASADNKAGERGSNGDAGATPKWHLIGNIRGTPGKDGADGSRGEKGDRGETGPPGKLSRCVPWASGVHYEGDLVSHQGSTYAAVRDTAAEPPHEDWSLVAARGLDAPVGDVRGLYKPGERYRKYDLVAFNGAEWRAKRDDPGELPGDGWAISAKQGKAGPKGERGERGPIGSAGRSAPALSEWLLDGPYRVVPVWSDGSTGPGLDLRAIFEAYHAEVGR